ncbi:MAG: alpha/beta hydrolase [Actinomycetota bacterium]
MATFALVHGAWHGAWCWEKVIPELEERGHRGIAMDMPIDDPAADWNTYASSVEAAIGDTSDELILVGHSMGGFVIPVVAERRPVKHCVFLASVLPVDESFVALMGSEAEMFGPDFAKLVDNGDGSTSWHRGDAIGIFYADCPGGVANEAYGRLRNQCMTHGTQRFPIERFPNAPSTYIACSEDRAVSPMWGRKRAESLGMDVITMDASHSPFLSKPAELAEILTGIATAS